MTPDQHLLFYPRLWKGTLALNAVMVVSCTLLWPQHVVSLMKGMGIGLLYLGSLHRSGQPQYKYMQIAFSLVRMVVFAAAIVLVANLNLMTTLIVIAGCFSYKWILVGLMVRETLHSLRLQSRSRPALSSHADMAIPVPRPAAAE